MDRASATIVAPATAPGLAALAVVRLSGPLAGAILGRVFRRPGGRPVPVRRPVLGEVVDADGRILDQATAVLFRAPRSATGEDLAELTVHGSTAVVRGLVESCLAAGAVAAEPGEFTARALRAGKLDLVQAEAVADLVGAATVEQARVAARQLTGEVGAALAPIADAVLDLLAEVEASLDFSEDEADLATSGPRLSRQARDLAAQLAALLERGESGRRVREGARVVLLGAPNAGKSSLFNRLVGHDRVIVTAEPGTTRDLVEELVVVEGLPILLCDAAGVGAPGSEAEALGMERALEAARGADLVLLVYDGRGARPPCPPGMADVVFVATNADRGGEGAAGDLRTSALTGEGLDLLRKELAARLQAPGAAGPESVVLATARHREAAGRCRDGLLEAAARLDGGGEGPELAALDLRIAVQALRELLGAVDPEHVLGRIFSRFCIGK